MTVERCAQYLFPPIEHVRRCRRVARVVLLCTERRYSDNAIVAQHTRAVCAASARVLSGMRKVPADATVRRVEATYWRCEEVKIERTP